MNLQGLEKISGAFYTFLVAQIQGYTEPFISGLDEHDIQKIKTVQTKSLDHYQSLSIEAFVNSQHRPESCSSFIELQRIVSIKHTYPDLLKDSIGGLEKEMLDLEYKYVVYLSDCVLSQMIFRAVKESEIAERENVPFNYFKSFIMQQEVEDYLIQSSYKKDMLALISWSKSFTRFKSMFSFVSGNSRQVCCSTKLCTMHTIIELLSKYELRILESLPTALAIYNPNKNGIPPIEEYVLFSWESTLKYIVVNLIQKTTYYSEISRKTDATQSISLFSKVIGAITGIDFSRDSKQNIRLSLDGWINFICQTDAKKSTVEIFLLNSPFFILPGSLLDELEKRKAKVALNVWKDLFVHVKNEQELDLRLTASRDLLEKAIKQGSDNAKYGLFMLDYKVEDLATHLTALDQALFVGIPISEYYRPCDSTNSKALGGRPCISAYVRRFNSVVHWAISEMLRSCSVNEEKDRVKVLQRLIVLANALIGAPYYNLHSSKAIVAALSSQPIHRLSHIWQKLTPRTLKTYQSMELLFSPDDNYTNLRKYYHRLLKSDTRIIPYLGIFVKDVTTVLENCNQYESVTHSASTPNIINFGRCQLLSVIYKQLLQMTKRTTRDFFNKKKAGISSAIAYYLSETENWITDESAQYRQSFIVEPK